MKNFLIVFFCVFNSINSWSQLVEIPDPNFVYWLNLNHPECMEGNIMDTQCDGITQDSEIYCDNYNVSSFEGIQYFINLEELYIRQNNLSAIPPLPNSVYILDISSNPLNILDSIPQSLKILELRSVGISTLPVLPDSLQSLHVNFNDLSELPEIPSLLRYLSVDNNPIDSLELNPGITHLSASNCNLEFIHSPLPNCTHFEVNGNNLTTIPELPDTLYHFNIEDNQIECLNYFPKYFSNSASLYISGNPFTCVPNYPNYGGGPVLSPDNYPLCSENDPLDNPFQCEAATGFEGYVHFDPSLQCDFNSPVLENIPVKIGLNGEVIALTNSLSNGRYLFQGDYGNYQIDIDETNLPFTNSCDSYNITLNAENQYSTDLNFALNCEYEDFGIQSIIPDGWVFPGQEHTIKVFAGELSQFYNANCSESTGGELSIAIEGPGEILGAASGTTEPFLSSDTLITFVVDDFTSLDLMDYFEIEIYTLTSAMDEDEICLTIQMTTSENDPNLANNFQRFCYPVVNSYDPNNKLVSPMTVEPGFDDWLFYTINFQNTGSAPAFNIRLEDDLPLNLNIETFQMTNTSHPSVFDLQDQQLTVHFSNIMLADSASNEPESKGYFQFKIKVLEPMNALQIINNVARIYFDYNDPIITNTAITKADLTSNIADLSPAYLKMFPNPTQNQLSLVCSEEIIKISCSNVLGESVEVPYHKETDKATLNFGSLKGVFFLYVKTQNATSIRKVIVE